MLIWHRPETQEKFVGHGVDDEQIGAWHHPFVQIVLETPEQSVSKLHKVLGGAEVSTAETVKGPVTDSVGELGHERQLSV